MRFLIAFLVLGIVSCSPEKSEFKSLSDQLLMKYHQLGEGDQPKIGDILQVFLLIKIPFSNAD